MGDEITERRSLMKSRKSVGDRTDPCGTPLFIDLKEGRWPSTTAAIERPEKKSERRIDSERRKFGNQSFVPDSIESFRYVQRHSKRVTDMPKSGGPRVRAKGKKITSREFLTKAILAIRDKIRRIEMVPNLPVKDRFENFRKNGG